MRRRAKQPSRRRQLPLPLLLLLLPAAALAAPDPQDLTTIRELTAGNIGKYSDLCKEDHDCTFEGSHCEPKSKKCLCKDDFPATNHFDKCGIAATINESCTFKEQCEMVVEWTGCRDNRCVCIFDKVPVLNKDGNFECIAEHKEPPDLRYIDPAMIGILAGMALMFIIICVVLRLFSKARWRDNRTIFNTPNARLMNVSLLRDNKLLHGQERRGSRASVRGPSRQPSMASLRAHSPNASQDEKILLTTDKGKRGSLAFAGVQDTRITENCTPLSPGSRTGSRRGSRGSSGNTSAVTGTAKPSSNHKSSSPPSNNHHHQHQNNLGSEPVLENVTVEILEDKS